MIGIRRSAALLYERNGGKPTDDQLEMWAKSAFLGASLGEIVDLNRAGEHLRLQQDEGNAVAASFGYSDEHIRRMASQDYWDAEYERDRGT